MHIGIILVNNQLDAQFFFIYLFQFSTCFEQPCAHHQESQLYQYDIWYMSLYVGDRLVCRFGRNGQTCVSDGQSDTYQILYWYNWLSWWWAHGCSKHVENWNKHIRKKNCASSWLFTGIISMSRLLYDMECNEWGLQIRGLLEKYPTVFFYANTWWIII